MKLLAVGGDEPGVVALGASAWGVFAFGQEARGFFAFGQIATGVFAFGQVATGVVAVGQVARGVIAIGQLAVGIAAAGQLAVGVGWAAGLGIGGTSGPGLVYGLFGRVRLRELGDHAYRLRARSRRLRGRIRGIPQDAIPSFIEDRRPWARSRLAGRVLRILTAVALAVVWWFAAGQAMVDGIGG